MSHAHSSSPHSDPVGIDGITEHLVGRVSQKQTLLGVSLRHLAENELWGRRNAQHGGVGVKELTTRNARI